MILLILLFLMTVVFHEFCHGYAAFLLGDDTAKRAGRLTLNPLRHIDPFWTVILPAMLFFSSGGRFAIGMAKPVPVNFFNLRNPKRDMIWVALAGPLANILLAALLTPMFNRTGQAVWLYAVYFNLGLACFNLLPIPPLDGSKVVAGLLPAPVDRTYLKFEKAGYVIVLLLYFSGFLIKWILPPVNFFCRLLSLPGLAL